MPYQQTVDFPLEHADRHSPPKTEDLTYSISQNCSRVQSEQYVTAAQAEINPRGGEITGCGRKGNGGRVTFTPGIRELSRSRHSLCVRLVQSRHMLQQSSRIQDSRQTAFFLKQMCSTPDNKRIPCVQGVLWSVFGTLHRYLHSAGHHACVKKGVP